MKNFARVLLVLMGIFDIMHLVFLVCMPFVGLKVFSQGIFYSVIYHSKELAGIAPEYKMLLNITSTIFYAGSLIIAILIITRGKQDIYKRLLWALIFTLIPFLLILLKVQFVPF